MSNQDTLFAKAVTRLLNILYPEDFPVFRGPAGGKEFVDKKETKVADLEVWLSNQKKGAPLGILTPKGDLGFLGYVLGDYYVFTPQEEKISVLHLHDKLPQEFINKNVIKLPWFTEDTYPQRLAFEKKIMKRGTTVSLSKSFYNFLSGRGEVLKKDLYLKEEGKHQYVYISPFEVSFFKRIWKFKTNGTNLKLSECEHKILENNNDPKKIIEKLLKEWSSLSESRNTLSDCKICVDYTPVPEKKNLLLHLLDYRHLEYDFEFSRPEEKQLKSLLLFPVNHITLRDVDLEDDIENVLESERVVYFSGTFQNTLLKRKDILSFRKLLSIMLNYSISNIYYPSSVSEMMEQGSKAAMTAIMSRNLSHNIGSHVLSYWNTIELKEGIGVKYAEVQGEAERETLFNEKRNLIYYSKNLFQYIQQRMDFLAEVSTSVPCSEISLDFENDIVNVALGMPDTSDFRHENLYPLLKYLAFSEKIELTKDSFDLTGIEDDCRRVSIPNGIVGSHAVCAIFENFVRNAAKYYNGKATKTYSQLDKKKLPKKYTDNQIKIFNEKSNCFNIRLSNENDITYINGYTELLEKIVADLGQINDLYVLLDYLKNQTNGEDHDFKIKIELKKPSEKKWQEKYIEFCIWDMREGSCNDEVYEKLIKYLDETKDDAAFVDSSGRIRSGGWGFKEMRIAANFLRKHPPEKILEKRNPAEPPLMEIMCGDCPMGSELSCKHGQCSHEEKHLERLGFRFYFLRPLHAAVLADNVKIAQKNNPIFAIRPLETGSENYPPGKEINHGMLLVSQKYEDERGYKTDPYAPFRVVITEELENKLEEVNDESYLDCYEHFIKKEFFDGKNLPKLLFTGGAYRKLFENNENNGQALEKYGGLCKAKNQLPEELKGLTDGLIVFYPHLKGKIEKKSIDLENYKPGGKRPLAVIPLSGGWTLAPRCDDKYWEGKIANLKKHFLLELIEACLVKVIVVDERISEFSKRVFASHTNSGRDRKTITTNGDMWNWMNIHVIKVDKETTTYRDLSEELKEIHEKTSDEPIRVFNNGKNGVLNPYVFIVHQGILDKLENNNAGDGKMLMKKIKCRWKIIDSGRGVPDAFQDYPGVRFVEISNILKVLESFDKHSLVQTIFSSRRPSQ